MKIHNLIQGSSEWQNFRLAHFGASEAAAMLGLSSKVKRSELLHMKHTCTAQEFSDWVQKNILDYGHEVEALARPIVEGIIGEDLYPVTCSENLLPAWCNYQPSASCDGLTMSEETAFEHKQWNEALAASVRDGVLPDEYQPQCQQIMMVTPAKRVIFTVSDGTPEKMVYMEVLPDQAWFNRILAGWEQFAKDLAAYVPPEVVAEVTGRTPATLPALRIEVTGMVTASNLEAFKEHSLAVFGAIKRDLQTDQDFADAEKTVKWCGDVEERLSAAKQHALSQTATIDELFRTIDGISAEARRVRLDLDRLVKARKESLREEIRQATVTALRAHYIEINASLGMGVMLGMPAAFGAEVANAMKGKKTLSSLRDAADTTLAGAKIDANATAERVRKNIAILVSHESHAFLLADGAQLATGKEPETLELIVKSRIADHQAAEAKRIEAERARIAEEERIKAEAAAECAAAAQRAELGRQQQEVARQQAVLEAAQRKREEEAAERAKAGDEHAAGIEKDVAPRAQEALAEQPSDAGYVPDESWPFHSMGTAAPAVPIVTPPTLRLGVIAERLGFAVSAELLRELGFEPADHSGRAVLFHEHQFPAIGVALIKRIEQAMAAHWMAEAA